MSVEIDPELAAFAIGWKLAVHLCGADPLHERHDEIRSALQEIARGELTLIDRSHSRLPALLDDAANAELQDFTHAAIRCERASAARLLAVVR